MRTIIRIGVLGLLLGGATLLPAQTVRRYNSPFGSLSSAKREIFSSLEGRYSIALPKQVGGFDRSTFQWRLPEGYFTVGYDDYDLDLEASKEVEVRALTQAQAAIEKFNYWLLENPVPPAQWTHKTVQLEGRPGVELRAEMPNGVGIARSIVFRKRIYSLAVMLVGEQRKDEAIAIEVFDSFRITPEDDAEAILRQRIADATPSPMPQEPVAMKLKSDAEDEHLKGQVKVVVQEIEILLGTTTFRRRHPTLETHYNEKGYLVKEVSYNDAGVPRDITVYGYVDGNKVSSSGSIDLESDPPAVLVTVPPGQRKPRDLRFGIRYAYKYGADGKLSEELMYGNSGALLGRTVYKRSANQLEWLHYSGNGSLSRRWLIVFDKDGNESEVTYFDSPVKGLNERYRYSYEFDAHGNWIKRVAILQRNDGVPSTCGSCDITYRAISYY